VASERKTKHDILLDGAQHSVELTRPAGEPSHLTAVIDGRRVEADAIRISAGVYSILLGGQSFEVCVEAVAGGLLAQTAGRAYRGEIADPRSWRGGRGPKIDFAGRQQISAPMAGKIVRVLVAPGQQVETGQGLLVVEAMKMQNEICSPKAGTVERLLAAEGQVVNAGEVIAVVA
jgi:biotin carboxyl carrier protein